MHKTNEKFKSYAAFLRGINVGGKHKVPMVELSELMHKWGFVDVKTILNSGNILFTIAPKPLSQIEDNLEKLLTAHFGFSIPVFVIDLLEIEKIVAQNPFAFVSVTKDIRLYVTFVKEKPSVDIHLPIVCNDNSFQIFLIHENMVFSFLDVSLIKTTDAMKELEKLFGKNISTRNWNTLQKMIH
ncbi:MAG: DUF1697 domain-containing protein [Bacteroidia bacterium]|nr:DUF1697 domain-containing protein [Bacteroidia bacterium]